MASGIVLISALLSCLVLQSALGIKSLPDESCAQKIGLASMADSLTPRAALVLFYFEHAKLLRFSRLSQGSTPSTAGSALLYQNDGGALSGEVTYPGLAGVSYLGNAVRLILRSQRMNGEVADVTLVRMEGDEDEDRVPQPSGAGEMLGRKNIFVGYFTQNYSGADEFIRVVVALSLPRKQTRIDVPLSFYQHSTLQVLAERIALSAQDMRRLERARERRLEELFRDGYH